jgi:DNA end-binding protein Ku
MVGKGVAALARVVMNKRERVIALEPHGKGLIGTTLHYAYEVRKAEDYFNDIPEIKIAPDMLKLAQHIVDTKAGHFQPEEFVDRYEVELVELLKTKQAGLPAKKPKPAMPRPSGANIFDLLRRSVNLEAKSKKTKAPPLQPAMAKKKAGTKQRARA